MGIMRIKIITCHDVYNVGASLQAYALMTYLQSLGNDVKIIDYKPAYLKHYKLIGVSNPVYDKPILRLIYNILKLPGRIKARYSKRKKEFDLFTEQYLSLTSQYKSNEELKNDLPEADVYIAGSDQIWNTLFHNGKDPAFYLEFVPNYKVRASYAASFATDSIDEELKPQIRNWLLKFDYISVRESTGIKIINELGIKKGIQVLDPVFLLTKSQWENIEKQGDTLEKFILVYDFDNDPQIKEHTLEIANKYSWKIYSVLDNDWCDRNFYQEGPKTFLWLIHHAQYIITNSFHAVAFSLIYQKDFLVFKRKENINTRILDLMTELYLDAQIIDNINFTFPLPKIEYSKVNLMLSKKISLSKEYIIEILTNGGKN